MCSWGAEFDGIGLECLAGKVVLERMQAVQSVVLELALEIINVLSDDVRLIVFVLRWPNIVCQSEMFLVGILVLEVVIAAKEELIEEWFVNDLR